MTESPRDEGFPFGENGAGSTSAPGMPGQKKKKRRPVLWTFVTLLSLVVLAGVAAFVYLGSLGSAFDTKANKLPSAFPTNGDRPAVTQTGDNKAVNILLVGSDSRESPASAAESGQPSDQRSDSMMLLHVPADHKSAYVVSIMRDTWVEIPGHGEAKINAALAFGGVPLMVQTVEKLLDQRIDHVAFINFEGFKGLTNAIGGVDVDVPIEFTSSGTGQNDGIHFPKGVMHMNGEQALAFVRERYSFADGDYQRVRDQRIYLKSLMNKMISPEVLANPVMLSNAVNEIAPFVTVDQDLTGARLGELALQLNGLRPSKTVFFTLPNAGTGWSDDGQSIVKLDAETTNDLAKALRNGTMPQFVDSHNLRGGN